jgi:hypothetical protein
MVICDEAPVTITNRWQDFPPWFDLHPLEVSGQFIPWMKQRMEACDYPEEPIDGPNIWRVKGGDRVVWVGLPRSEQTSVDGVLGIVDCPAAVVVLGEIPMSARRQGDILDELFPFMHFEQSPQAIALRTAGLKADRASDCLRSRILSSGWDDVRDRQLHGRDWASTGRCRGTLQQRKWLNKANFD